MGSVFCCIFARDVFITQAVKLEGDEMDQTDLMRPGRDPQSLLDFVQFFNLNPFFLFQKLLMNDDEFSVSGFEVNFMVELHQLCQPWIDLL